MNRLEHTEPERKRNTGNQLSSSEVQAMLMLGREDFKPLDRDAVIRAGSKIFRTSEKNVEGWRQLSGSDSQNVFVSLLAHLGEWADGLELSRTPNGGMMQMRNVRLCELASGKCDRGGRKKDEHGTEFPCLEDFGFSICCAMVRGPQDRMWSYFRICYADEVKRRDGKKIPYKPPVSSRPTAPRTAKTAPTVRQSPLPPNGGDDGRMSTKPEQTAMFDTHAFVNFETGGRR